MVFSFYGASLEEQPWPLWLDVVVEVLIRIIIMKMKKNLINVEISHLALSVSCSLNFYIYILKYKARRIRRREKQFLALKGHGTLKLFPCSSPAERDKYSCGVDKSLLLSFVTQGGLVPLFSGAKLSGIEWSEKGV